MEEEANWMRRAKWGVFAHYLGGTTSEEWNKQIDAFDVNGLVGQLKEVNPGYFCLTLGQNSGFYCSPNGAYERYAEKVWKTVDSTFPAGGPVGT